MACLLEVIEYVKSEGIVYRCEGDEKAEFETYCPLNSPKENALTWVRNAATLDVSVLNSIAGVILIAEIDADIQGAHFPILYAENAHRTFFRILAEFFGEFDPEQREPAISSTAVVESFDVGAHLFVGHHTYIGPDVRIGDHVTILHNVTIQGKVRIGNYTTIESGTVIGVCGFGQYWDEEGNPHTVSHLGGVVIGQHVRIGANCAISRGCLADTVVGDYVQVDNLSHIAHNDVIGKRAILTANTVIAGSSTIGEDAWLAPGSLVMNATNVGKDAFLGLGSVVIKDVPEGKKAFGNPARVTGQRRG